MGTKHGLSAEERFWAKVNKTDTCWLWTAGVNDQGYGKFGINGTSYRAHRIAWSWYFGLHIREFGSLDHMCHDRRCIKKEHLRLVTHKQNIENRAKPNRNNTSGYIGVGWAKHEGKWRARVKDNYKDVHVGFFDDVHEAGEAARLKRLELQTHNDRDRK